MQIEAQDLLVFMGQLMPDYPTLHANQAGLLVSAADIGVR